MQHLFLQLFAFNLMVLFATAATLPPGLVEKQIATNLPGVPTSMAFAPDGRLFVCLQQGQVRVIKNGFLLSTPFLSIPVDSFNERGLLGIAFDPNFATNHYVYLYHTIPGSPPHNRISRYTAAGDIAISNSEAVILDLNSLSGDHNNGGALHFGPDGKLYVGVGDGGNSSNAQTLSNLLGKILRINADGSIPVDNPFYNTATGNNRAIWALGLKNPFTFAFQPASSRMFINDVGTAFYEEVNDGIAGSNYGFPVTEGPTTNPAFRGPIYYYGHATGCAIVGSAFYNTPVPQLPLAYLGKYFFADLCSGWIHVLDPMSHTVGAFASGISSPTNLEVGPDGALYYLASGSGGQVFRVSAMPGVLANISTRLGVGTDSNVLIGGFIIGGIGPKPLLLRALGPTLTQFNVTGVLADPFLSLVDGSGNVLWNNDNWKDSQQAAIQATGLAPPNDLESAILQILQPGNYTAILSGKNGTTGAALVEVYDIATGATSHLTNISTRGLVKTTSDVMIAGLIVQSRNEQVIVRALGPTLANFGITGALADPTLTLLDANGTVLAFNDNWKNTQQAEITATGKAPPDDRESAIMRTLVPGKYTAVVRGMNNTTGLALVEAYALQ